ncbi:MAG TPA: TIGR00730 family Rossman fold protein [Caulobacteraceae bacterium]|nr:TIGR00730 family Rossman fold protein [Caulobacteraceae bacterium]
MTTPPSGPQASDSLVSGAQVLRSMCVFCASSDGVDPQFLAGARRLGADLARAEVRLVYGGGGVGLMGACARAAHAAGGQVLGVMPTFLRSREGALDEVETVFVQSMHERKAIMFDQSDAFAVLPGGIGTLEEVVELLSWRRLALHAKPIVFLNPGGYWTPLFDLFSHTVAQGLSPEWFMDAFRSVEHAEEVLPAARAMLAAATPGSPDPRSLT